MAGDGVLSKRFWLFLWAYVPLLGLLSIALAKRDPDVRWHAWNGLLLFAATAAAVLVATLVAVLAPSTSCLYAAAMAGVLILYAGISLLSVVMALTNRRLMIPGISRHASRLASR